VDDPRNSRFVYLVSCLSIFYRAIIIIIIIINRFLVSRASKVGMVFRHVYRQFTPPWSAAL